MSNVTKVKHTITSLTMGNSRFSVPACRNSYSSVFPMPLGVIFLQRRLPCEGFSAPAKLNFKVSHITPFLPSALPRVNLGLLMDTAQYPAISQVLALDYCDMSVYSQRMYLPWLVTSGPLLASGNAASHRIEYKPPEVVFSLIWCVALYDIQFCTRRWGIYEMFS